MKGLEGRLKKLESIAEPYSPKASVAPEYWPRLVAAEGFTWEEMERQFGDIPGFAYWLMCKPGDKSYSHVGDPAAEYMRMIGR